MVKHEISPSPDFFSKKIDEIEDSMRWVDLGPRLLGMDDK